MFLQGFPGDIGPPGQNGPEGPKVSKAQLYTWGPNHCCFWFPWPSLAELLSWLLYSLLCKGGFCFCNTLSIWQICLCHLWYLQNNGWLLNMCCATPGKTRRKRLARPKRGSWIRGETASRSAVFYGVNQRIVLQRGYWQHYRFQGDEGPIGPPGATGLEVSFRELKKWMLMLHLINRSFFVIPHLSARLAVGVRFGSVQWSCGETLWSGMQH